MVITVAFEDRFLGDEQIVVYLSRESNGRWVAADDGQVSSTLFRMFGMFWNEVPADWMYIITSACGKRGVKILPGGELKTTRKFLVDAVERLYKVMLEISEEIGR